MSAHEIEQHEFDVVRTCRYLLDVPKDVKDRPVLVVALHGYSANPQDMLRLARLAVGESPVVAAVEGPNQHYVTAGLPDGQSVPGYNWGISAHWESAVRLHHAMVGKVLERLQARFQSGPERCVLLGFSQPVGLNYRFAATQPGAIGGVIGVCGGVPRDWEEPKYQRVTAALLHISRDEDPYYPAGTAAGFGERLRARAKDVEFHMLPGPHRFPSKAREIVRPWMQRIFAD